MVNHLGQLALQEGSSPSPQTHLELLRMIDQLRLAVESPTETVLRLIYQVYYSTAVMVILPIADLADSKPPQNATLRTVVDMGIFPLLMEKQYRETGISADKLAKFSHAEKDLVGKRLHNSFFLAYIG